MAVDTSKAAARRERLLRHVSMEPNSGCWLWTGGVNHGGYGQFSDGRGKNGGAHRAAYEVFVGPIPEGLTLDHLCRVRCCVNPAHLEPVSMQENLRRGNSHLSASIRHSKKEHCPKGHPYLGANLYIGTRGQRLCRRCHNDRTLAAYYARKAAKNG